MMLRTAAPPRGVFPSFLLWGGLLCCFLLACTPVPKPPEGGRASQRVGVPWAAQQEMTQPQAPEGVSKQFWEERVTTHSPDGVTTVREIRAGTELGGSQDWAAIVREYARADTMKRILLGLGLLIGGGAALWFGWPVLGVVLFLGAGASAFGAWWMGLLAVVAGGLVYFAFKLGAAAALGK